MADKKEDNHDDNDPIQNPPTTKKLQQQPQPQPSTPLAAQPAPPPSPSTAPAPAPAAVPLTTAIATTPTSGAATKEQQNELLESVKMHAMEIKNFLSQSEYAKYFAMAALPVLIAVSVATKQNPLIVLAFVVYQILKWIWNILGIAVGVGLGLGLALHVYQLLQSWETTNGNASQFGLSNTASVTSALSSKTSSAAAAASSSLSKPVYRKPKLAPRTGSAASSFLEDGSSFASLLLSAGYDPTCRNKKVVTRAQILKQTSSFWQLYYPFTNVPDVTQRKGPQVVMETWPTLPKPVAIQIGQWIEHIMRDYVSSWYSMVDQGIVYENERLKRQRLAAEAAKAEKEKTKSKESASKTDNKETLQTQNQTQQQSTSSITSSTTQTEPQHNLQQQDKDKIPRAMVFGTQRHRPAPLIDHTYRVLAIVFGNLASRVEHVNIFSMALLEWTRVLANTFRVYRTLRRKAANPKSEMSVAREFLVAGNLHQACTFGMDVPSLLFADKDGKECGTGNASFFENSDDEVLEQRLFNTNILSDCCLDYHRVLAHRMCRALLPRSEWSSAMLSSVLVEVFAGCALSPLMNLFVPVVLNGWLVSGLAKKTDNDDAAAANNNNSSSRNNINKDDKKNGNRDNVTKATTDDIVLIPETDPHTQPVLDDDDDDDDHVENVVVDLDLDIMANDNSKSLMQDEGAMTNTPSPRDLILTILAEALADLQQYIDFADLRSNPDQIIDWDGIACQSAVVRIVLIIEGALLHGRNKDKEETNGEYGGFGSLSQLLMELTSDVDAFDKRLDKQQLKQDEAATAIASDVNVEGKSADTIEGTDEVPNEISSDNNEEEYKPEPGEVSTLRTLIAAWMQTGQLYKVISVIAKAHKSYLVRFYNSQAFLADPSNADALLRRIQAVNGVAIMVDTMAVLASPRIDLQQDFETLAKSKAEQGHISHEFEDDERALQDEDETESSSVSNTFPPPRLTFQQQSQQQQQNFGSTASTERHLDFHRNSAIASSLRAERERRLRSWEMLKTDDNILMVHRKGASEAHIELHNELHHIARIFYNGTNVMAIRDAARRNDTDDAPADSSPTQKLTKQQIHQSKVALLTVEMASNRRRIEVPDDDSSFLLRAQPRPLNPVSVHRDDRNHDLSFKCFLATYEEPAFVGGSNRYNGGRYIRRCLLQYYPIDRTATIMIHNDARKLDKRKGKPLLPEQVGASPQKSMQQSAPFLSGAFLRERHLCQKWFPKGVARNVLASSVMELSDFNANPRSGKALDFIYRMSLFERPTVDLAGKRFTVHDSAGRGPHRADASSLELSDASLSGLLLTIGRDWEQSTTDDDQQEQKQKQPQPSDKDSPNTNISSNMLGTRHKVEMGPDGYPMIFMKLSRKQGDKINVDIKPYRLSFVRAALLVTSARQEAQLQCLVDCVKAGSAKSATKARTEAHLRPTIKILECANDQSSDKIRSSRLVRDLKLGVYHIDREQLRRNGVFDPRSPTVVKELTAKVEGAYQAKDCGTAGKSLPPTLTLYKIRCQALVALDCTTEEELEHIRASYLLEDGTIASSYVEEWVIFRPMKDFQTLHKHLKSQVASSESSVSTGSRLVGAATAAFTTAAGGIPGRRQRRALIPSLAQASKTGAIAVTRKSIMKRGELLDEYIEYLLAADNLLNRSTEVLLFLGALYPLPSEVRVNQISASIRDPMGRIALSRRVASSSSSISMQKMEASVSSLQTTTITGGASRRASNHQHQSDSFSTSSNDNTESNAVGGSSLQKRNSSSASLTAASSVQLAEGKASDPADVDERAEIDIDADLNPTILSKIDQAPLAEVRNRILELVKYQFGFENASFFRSRMLSALETASFVAMTKASGFRRMLYDIHVQHLNPDAIAGWIKMVLDILWPDGVWLVPAPALSKEEEKVLCEKTRQTLHAAFPEHIRTVFGRELTRDGLDMLHEMLQNRLVVKSLFYMLFDLLWLEVFPELRDVLTCDSALETH